MGYKLLEVTLISANGLKTVNHFGEMNVYVAVSFSGSPSSKKKTPVHKRGGDCPSWNHTVSFTFNESTALGRDWAVVFKIKHHRSFGRDKPVGEVRVPVKELLGFARGSVSFEVRTTSGKSKGELTFSCKQRDTPPPLPPPKPVYQQPPPVYQPPPCHYAHERHGRARPSGGDGLGMFVAGMIGGALLDEILF